MERLRERMLVAKRALKSLEEVAGQNAGGDIVRDAAIQRFEFTFEAVWKAAQRYLNVVEGTVEASPKGVVRASVATGLLAGEEGRLAMDMVDDRNLTVHTYNEALARRIFAGLAGYVGLMRRWLDAMDQRVK